MQTSFTFGYVNGIPLRVHLNWLLTAILVTWSLAAGYFPQRYPGWGMSTYWIVGFLTAILFFGSVLLHELGHALISQRENVPVNSITLFIFGGVAQIAREPDTAGAEFRIVAAGPLTSLVLSAAFAVLGLFLIEEPYISGAALYLSQMNLILALFNLIPGFPLDGGRILRSIIWKISHNFQMATRWATNAGLGVALLFIAGGITLLAYGDILSGAWVAFIGWYLGSAARESARQLEPEEEIPAALRPDKPFIRKAYQSIPVSTRRKLTSQQGSTFMLLGVIKSNRMKQTVPMPPVHYKDQQCAYQDSSQDPFW